MVNFSSKDVKGNEGHYFFLARILGHRIWFHMHGRRELTLRGIGGRFDAVILTPYETLNSARDFRWVLDYLKTPATRIHCIIFEWGSGREILGRDVTLMEKRKQCQQHGINAMSRLKW